MMGGTDYLPGFLERCTLWLVSEGRQGEVVSVAAANNEWAGSTEDGFRDELEITVTYVRDGAEWQKSLGASEQERLWRFVMGSPIPA